MSNKINYNFYTNFLGTSFFVLIIYICLISFDWCLKIYVNLNKLQPVIEAQTIEKNYKKNIIFKAKEKREFGFKPMFYPKYFNKTKEYNALNIKYSTLPLGVLPNTKYYVCDEGYGLTTFKSDKFGFWNSNNIYENNIDIMIIGDSISMNGCLHEKETFVGMLKKNYNVMNLSMGSNDPVHYASAAQIFIPHFKPKIVLMVFTRGDFIDHYSQKTHIYKKKFFDKKINYFDKKRTNLNFPESYKKNLLDLLKEAQKLTDSNIGKYEKLTPVKKPSIFKRFGIMLSTHYKLTYILNVLINKNYLPYGNLLALNTLNENCKIFDCIGTIAYIPGSSFWRPDSRQNKHAALLNEKSNMLEKLKFLNLTKSFENLDIEGYSPKGSHLSIKGNKIVFDKLINFFKDF
ncbi:hypothetical protein OAO09_02100 [Candidatus Pelagibacter sp.]|nr:hypothetical protein [Candidatus Pelagibacter sp.]